MKDKRDNEIDLLLRRMSRRDGSAVPEQEIDEKHLDADELNAYAQNALPPAARTRYIEHLAECTSCRRLATELSLSLGATTVAEVETVPTPSGLKAFLASLFSPMVLRYAVPALGVIVVMVVGFVVLRQQRQLTTRDLVAQDTKQERVAAANGAVATPTPGVSGFIDSDNSSTQESAGIAEAAKPATKTAEPKPEPTAVATDSIGRADQQLPTAQRSVAELQPGVAASTPAPAKAAPAETEADKKLADAEKKVEAATETVEVRNEPAPTPSPSPTSYQSANANTNEEAAQNKAKTSPATQAGGLYSVRGLSAVRRREEAKRDENAKTDERAKDEAKENARDDAETRSVAGRQFRKARGIWVDTAYDSSTATVNMARGSEQFRALIADEPVIGTIAKQLDGEVIVVWKGRAYRIR